MHVKYGTVCMPVFQFLFCNLYMIVYQNVPIQEDQFLFLDYLDVQTQAMYQMMDEGFVGLIFSCFNEDSGSCVS